MSHGPQGEGWRIMWDNCWIALASESQKGREREEDKGEEEDREEEENDRRIQQGPARWVRQLTWGVSVPWRWGKSRGGNYYKRRQVKLD